MRADPVQEAAQAAGVRVTVTPEDQASQHAADPILDHAGFKGDPRFVHAKARIARILEGAGQAGAKTIASGIRDAEIPKLAREYVELIAHYKFFRHRRSRWNPFLDMSDVDAAKMFVAEIYNICDRSTGRMGPWH